MAAQIPSVLPQFPADGLARHNGLGLVVAATLTTMTNAYAAASWSGQRTGAMDRVALLPLPGLARRVAG